MSVLVARAGGLPAANFPMGPAAAAGAGGDDGEKRPPVGPLGKRSRSTHEEDNTVHLPWLDVAYGCESCRLTFHTMTDLLVHLAPSPERCNIVGFGYYMFVVSFVDPEMKIYMVDDGVSTAPPLPLPGEVHHVPTLNFNQIVTGRAVTRYLNSGHIFHF